MQKKFFSRDLEKILKIKRRTLFYWEDTNKVPKAKRTSMGNYRYWTKNDVNKLKQIIGE